MQNRSRRGFTLFQLLVLIAILAFLFALLFPVIARVRVAAARARSSNNLKQIALAVHNYHDVNNALPPGNDGNNFSVAAHVLPYIEQGNLYKLIDFKKPSTDPANAAVRGSLVKTFLDPRDPQMVVVAGSGATNYLFCAGSKTDLRDNDGLFFQSSKLRFSEVTDGLSNTIMAGETLKGDGSTMAKEVRRQHIVLDREALKSLKGESGVQEWKEGKHIAGDRRASWLDGRFLQGTFTGTLQANDERPDVNCAGFGGLSGLRSLDDKITIAMADGSVRTTRQNLGLPTWKALCTRNGAEMIPDF